MRDYVRAKLACKTCDPVGYPDGIVDMPESVTEFVAPVALALALLCTGNEFLNTFSRCCEGRESSGSGSDSESKSSGETHFEWMGCRVKLKCECGCVMKNVKSLKVSVNVR